MTTDRKQVALVTGGRSGIGQACARNLASQGIQVFTAQRQDDPEFDSICADLADTDAPRQKRLKCRVSLCMKSGPRKRKRRTPSPA